MKTIEVLTEATSLKDLVALAKQEEVVLTEHDQPVAKVVAVAGQAAKTAPAAQRRKLGLHPGAWEVSGDFDEPLPDEFWLGKG